jgi:hypothetical protein
MRDSNQILTRLRKRRTLRNLLGFIKIVKCTLLSRFVGRSHHHGWLSSHCMVVAEVIWELAGMKQVLELLFTMVADWIRRDPIEFVTLHLVQDSLLEHVSILQTLREDVESLLNVVYSSLYHGESLLKLLECVIVVIGVSILRVIRSGTTLHLTWRTWPISCGVWQVLLVKNVPCDTDEGRDNVLPVALENQLVAGLC